MNLGVYQEGYKKMIGKLVTIYRKLPIKPFQGVLGKLYRKYKLLYRNKVVIAVKGGIRWELDLKEQIDSSIYYEGCFEPTTTAVINRYVKEGMTVLDIGANIGCHTLRFAKLVGKMGKVIAFEPMSWAFSKLKRNVELNNFDNITLERIALSDESKGERVVQFYASWPLDADLSDSKIHPIHHGERMENTVEVITLDDYVQRENIKKIDFVKLDVDGYEYKVIGGGTNTIKKFKPVMIIEFSKYTLREYGDNLEKLIDLLISL